MAVVLSAHQAITSGCQSKWRWPRRNASNGPTLKRLAVDEFRRGGTVTVEIRDLAHETVYIVQSFRAGRGTRLLAVRRAVSSDLHATDGPLSALHKAELA